MADPTKPTPQSQSKDAAAPALSAEPDHAKPGWPCRIVGTQLTDDFYAQFPKRYRPRFDAAQPFEVSSTEQVKKREFYEKLETTLVLVVNMCSATRTVRVPRHDGVSVATVAPLGGVIALPEEEAKKHLAIRQNMSGYAIFRMLEPKGNCGGKGKLKIPAVNDLGNVIDTHGEEVSKSHREPAAGTEFSTCRHLACAHGDHFHPEAPPLSIAQAQSIIQRMVEVPIREDQGKLSRVSYDLRTPEDIINMIGAFTESMPHEAVNRFAMWMTRFVQRRAAHIKALGRPVRWEVAPAS